MTINVEKIQINLITSESQEEVLRVLAAYAAPAAGNGANGTNGIDGKSAYDIAVDDGFVGTEAEWLLSLKGADGAAGSDGADGADGVAGKQGKSAYDIAVDDGFVGTEAEWLLSLKGADGAAGAVYHTQLVDQFEGSFTLVPHVDWVVEHDASLTTSSQELDDGTHRYFVNSLVDGSGRAYVGISSSDVVQGVRFDSTETTANTGNQQDGQSQIIIHTSNPDIMLMAYPLQGNLQLMQRQTDGTWGYGDSYYDQAGSSQLGMFMNGSVIFAVVDFSDTAQIKLTWALWFNGRMHVNSANFAKQGTALDGLSIAGLSIGFVGDWVSSSTTSEFAAVSQFATSNQSGAYFKAAKVLQYVELE
jgi:hypothetical protein